MANTIAMTKHKLNEILKKKSFYEPSLSTSLHLMLRRTLVQLVLNAAIALCLLTNNCSMDYVLLFIALLLSLVTTPATETVNTISMATAISVK